MAFIGACCHLMSLAVDQCFHRFRTNAHRAAADAHDGQLSIFDQPAYRADADVQDLGNFGRRKQSASWRAGKFGPGHEANPQPDQASPDVQPS